MNLFKEIKNLASDVTGNTGPIQNWYITAERAEGLKDKDLFSKSDPYLKIEFGGKHFKTRSIKNDRSPYWNETFHFKLSASHVNDIHITVMDSDITFDDTIGSATISRADLPTRPGEEKYLKVPVYRKEQISGVVHLRVKQVDDGQVLPSSDQPVYQNSNVSYPQQQMSSQSQYTYGSQQQPMSSSYNPQYNQPPNYNTSYQQSYNQTQPSNYNQTQPSNYNQTQPNYNQNPPNYNQNQYNSGQMPPMMNQQFQPMNQPPQQPYMNQPNYYSNQYERRY